MPSHKARGKSLPGKKEHISRQIQANAARQRDSTPLKRRKLSSDEGSDYDPDMLIDVLLGSLGNDESLLERFVSHLLRIPNMQKLIVSHVTDIIHTKASDGEIHDMGNIASQSLINSVQGLAAVVKDLKGELVKSNNKYDDLEQYTRRNSIRISGIPENQNLSVEDAECDTLNKYIESPVSFTNIDRCHRISDRRCPK